MSRQIMYATDFSSASRPAFAKAVELAKRDRTGLIVVHVMTPPAWVGDGYISPSTLDEIYRRGVAPAFRQLFNVFLGSYLAASGDTEIFETLPPFFAFRLLVLAHPRWYPTLSDATRAELLGLARCMVTSTRFDPADRSWLCGDAQ